MEVTTGTDECHIFSQLFYLCLCPSIQAQCYDVSALKISKETSEKYQQLLEDEKEYVVEKLLDVRECNNGDFEFLTKWEGYTEDQNSWEKIETFNGPLSEL